MHILSVDQFNKTQLETIFRLAKQFHEALAQPAQRPKLYARHQGKQLCSLFYEPSTRTRISFEKAALNLGMGVVSTENAREFSSSAKGESIEDTLRVLNQYGFDVIVMRHYETGGAAQAAAVSQAPVINAGDGAGEHPTQAVLDAYTIYEHFGRLNNLRIVLGGDLKHGRTVRSLARLLAQYDNISFCFTSIPELQMGNDIKAELESKGVSIEETSDLARSLKDADVVYWTRIQKERLADPAAISPNAFTLSSTNLTSLPKDAIIMHPLPRLTEISPDIDTDPRAKYFEQAGNGLYVRMALLDMVLSPHT